MAITQSLIDSFICRECGELFQGTVGGRYIGCPNWHGKLRRKSRRYDAVANLLARPLATKISSHPVRFHVDGHAEAVFRPYRRKRDGHAKHAGFLSRVKYGYEWWRRRLVREVPNGR